LSHETHQMRTRLNNQEKRSGVLFGLGLESKRDVKPDD